MWIPSRVTCAAAVLEISGKAVHGTPSAAPRPIPPFSPVCRLLSPYIPLLPTLPAPPPPVFPVFPMACDVPAGKPDDT